MSDAGYPDAPRPPAWEFTAAETAMICTALRRQRHPNSPWPKSGASDDELDELLDRLYRYLSLLQRWENLYLPPLEDTPF